MAAFRKKKGAEKMRLPDGKLRQSQLVTTFGPGAMVDLIDTSVVIGGLEHWTFDRAEYQTLDEPRLRASLNARLRALSPELELAPSDYFRTPPAGKDDEPSLFAGVRTLEFPRWFVCQGCGRLGQARDLFEQKGERYRHQCAGKNKTKTKMGRCVPVRFVAACRQGHLSDFPWVAFAHAGAQVEICDRPELYLYEGATGDFGRIRVQCENCGAGTNMRRADAVRFRCHGERPWIGGSAANETDCDERIKLLVRTASDAYFSQVVSALRLEEDAPSELQIKLREPDMWNRVKKVESVEMLKMLAQLQDVVASLISAHSAEEVFQAIVDEREEGRRQAPRPLRTAEFERITSSPVERPGVMASRGQRFAAFRVPKSKLDLPKGISGLVVVPELREVRVQVSFSRLDSVNANLQGEYDFESSKIRPAPLTLPEGTQRWLPAAEIRGEGIFIELDEDAVQEWEQRPAVIERTTRLMQAFEADGRGGAFLGARFYMLHSLSHLLLTAISLECGYAASAIRERIYCAPKGGDVPPMAAILLSTGTTGSEGTLGGLVEEGRRIRRHLREAWELGRLCSNDPVCASHDPSSESSDRRTEGAACHGCLYIAESACERFNRYLDRGLVVPTIGNDPSLAFFEQRP